MNAVRPVAVLLCLVTTSITAQQQKAEPPREELRETVSVTKHSIDVGGQPLRYTATAGTIVLKDDKDKAQASMFYVAYIRDDVPDRTKRPIFYSFNGGPGTASVWMHMGFTGPRRVVYDEEGMMLSPPYRLADNEHTILDIADIVYIDPVATGYSRMATGEDPHKFHGVLDDIKSVAEFIRIWTTRNSRWDSPKFIIGESYGTTRAAGLAGYLQDQHQMYLNGVILVSSTGLGVEAGSDLRYALLLPHYTATAWYHKALIPELQAASGSAAGIGTIRAWWLPQRPGQRRQADGGRARGHSGAGCAPGWIDTGVRHQQQLARGVSAVS
jgi:carboxypeptidase C (cathepsin A)